MGHKETCNFLEFGTGCNCGGTDEKKEHTESKPAPAQQAPKAIALCVVHELDPIQINYTVQEPGKLVPSTVSLHFCKNCHLVLGSKK